MSLIKPPNQRRGDENLIPMINIVFLLLIFFMIAGQIQNSMPENIQLPVGETGVPAEIERVALHIGAEGYLSVDGKQLTPAQLDKQLALSQQASWVLVADKMMPARQLDGVLRRIQKAGVLNLTLMTQRTALAP